MVMFSMSGNNFFRVVLVATFNDNLKKIICGKINRSSYKIKRLGAQSINFDINFMNMTKAIAFPRIIFHLLFFMLFLWACSTDPETPEPKVNQYLVESSLKSEFDQALIKNFVTLSGFP